MSETNVSFQPIVQELADRIEWEGWGTIFDIAIDTASSPESRIVEMQGVNSLTDYLKFIDSMLKWVPSESRQGSDIYNELCKFYFVLDQPSVIHLQPPIRPKEGQPRKTWLSDWLVRYAKEMGKFLDTRDSINARSVASFRNSPNYNMDDYIEPPGGWLTFNQFFARKFKSNNLRPIAAINDPTVIVSGADSVFDGQWEIRSDSGITIKNVHWKIRELLADSKFQDAFNNGIFMHSFLGPNDYHRQHAPVGGIVVEARVIPGQVYLKVEAVPVVQKDGYKRLRLTRRSFDAPDTPGYQFSQARGLIVLETDIGYVAVLPIGMAQVSSVILSVEKGQRVDKGDELSYFQFGGSDYILVFQRDSNVSITAQVGVHYKVGTRIGQAYPVMKTTTIEAPTDRTSLC